MASSAIRTPAPTAAPAPAVPATLPLSAPGVGNQLVQYLDDSWETIINRDVAGRDSTAQQLDNRLGHRSTEVVFGRFLQLLKNQRRNLRRRVLLALRKHGHVISLADHLVGDQLCPRLHAR